ncbi:MAG: alpha/beta fold hydrolase [Gammaproteobacteria bacterium]|nr:alpha/beta fold hydrolase [Gammaproteobacteria bacterium]
MPAIQRHFVTVHDRFGPRQVHYRRGGHGPAVLLLHQSPQSSREMEPLMAAWSDRFTLIAPDSPGYGLSDPLQRDGVPVSRASMDDFAGATLAFADALALGRFGVYGYHTGASIGLAMAHAGPKRIAALAGNGLVVLTGDERDTILQGYLPPLVPRWDGGHLAWLWARLREQAIFFPWHDRRAATRMRFDMPPPERLQLALQEFLAAGEHYAVAYAAAFDLRAEDLLPDLGVPVLITAAARDPLALHLARIGPTAAGVRILRSATPEDALARALAHLDDHPGDSAPDLPPGLPSTAAPANACAGPAGRQIRLRRAGLAGARRVVLIHPVGGEATLLDPVSNALAAAFEVVAPDLPGHGGSDPPGGDGGVRAVAARLSDVLAEALPTHGDTLIVGFETAAAVTLELQRQLGAGVRAVLVDPPLWSAAAADDWLACGLPALRPVWSGGHLLEAWHLVRDARLFHPWFRRDTGSIRSGDPDLDDAAIHRDVRALLRAEGHWQQLLRNTIACLPEHALQGAASGVRGRARIATRPGNAWSTTWTDSQRTALNASALPADPTQWAAWLMAC